MERLEQILKWSWLAVPFMFAGWTLMAIECFGLIVLGMFLAGKAINHDHWFEKYPVISWTMILSFISFTTVNVCLLVSWSNPPLHTLTPPFHELLSKWTILHWIGIL